MIIVFDLDDTLYDEIDFVLSGFRAVSQYGLDNYGLSKDESFKFMQDLLDQSGRGRIFDLWLKKHGLYSKSRVAQCVKVYRHHWPEISLSKIHIGILEQLANSYTLYLVTDGHKVAQDKKCKALNVDKYFSGVFITHRYGLSNAKPSLYCFEKIKQAEGVSWDRVVYIGDNPAKDFVNLNKVGAVTVRVHTGSHAGTAAKNGYDAWHHIQDLTDVPKLIGHLNLGKTKLSKGS